MDKNEDILDFSNFVGDKESEHINEITSSETVI